MIMTWKKKSNMNVITEEQWSLEHGGRNGKVRNRRRAASLEGLQGGAQMVVVVGVLVVLHLGDARHKIEHCTALKHRVICCLQYAKKD